MLYYFLDGLDKKGPYSAEELKMREVTPETLVFGDGMDKWTSIKDIPELNQKVFLKTNQSSITPKEEKAPASKNRQGTSPTKKQSTNTLSLWWLLIAFILMLGISYGIVYLQKENNRTEIDKKIAEVFKNHNVITDYQFDGTDGQLHEIFLNSMWGFGEKNIVQTKKITLAMKPSPSNEDNERYGAYYKQQQKHWDLFSNLVQYYESTPYTGFDVLKLEQEGDDYAVTKIWSGDMAYKVPEFRHYDGYSNAFYVSPGYDLPTHRPSVYSCYEEAAKFLTEESKDKSYEPGVYNKLAAFENIQTKFFQLSQNFPKYTRLLDKINVELADNRTAELTNDSKITSATSRIDPNVFTSQWIVWYKSITNRYSVTEKQGVLLKLWLLYSAIGLVLLSGFYIAIRFKRQNNTK